MARIGADPWWSRSRWRLCGTAVLPPSKEQNPPIQSLTPRRSMEQLTGWFSLDQQEYPLRVGVYEGTASGIPGVHPGTLQHGYYYWDGWDWNGWGATIEEAANQKNGYFKARHWRGVVPGNGYPLVEVDALTPLRGVLLRQGHVDKLKVRCALVDGASLKLWMARDSGNGNLEEYRCVLPSVQDHYAGLTQGKANGYKLPAITVEATLPRPGATEKLAWIVLRPSTGMSLTYSGNLIKDALSW
jgi:hypothetical protein